MGSGGSTNHMEAAQSKRSIEDVVNVMMPVYYTSVPVSDHDHMLATKSWDLILDDKSPVYIEGCKDPAGEC